MSVRITPSGAGSTTSPGTRYPRSAPTPFDLTEAAIGVDIEPQPQAPAVEEPGLGAATCAAAELEPGREPPMASRSELRAARHQRRRLMVVCAVVIAVCLALTIVVVGLARNRVAGSQSLPSVRTGRMPGPAWSTTPSSTHPANPDALAS
jgi:hypothetical protein